MTDATIDYLRNALDRIAGLGGASGVLARAAIRESHSLERTAAADALVIEGVSLTSNEEYALLTAVRQEHRHLERKAQDLCRRFGEDADVTNNLGKQRALETLYLKLRPDSRPDWTPVVDQIHPSTGRRLDEGLAIRA